MGVPDGSAVKNLPAVHEMWVRSLGQEDPLEEEIITYSVFLPRQSHGQRSMVASVHGVAKSWP